MPGRKTTKKARKKFKLREISERSIEILPLVELAIYEVDRIFENQGKSLTDVQVVDSLTELVREIKTKSLSNLLKSVRDELDEKPDIIHWNILSKLDERVEEKLENYTDSEIIRAIEDLIDTIKIQLSEDNPRAYLSFLCEVMGGGR